VTRGSMAVTVGQGGNDAAKRLVPARAHSRQKPVTTQSGYEATKP
jgi:hypothetical protein